MHHRLLNIGLIEGFFGKSWSWRERSAQVKFLAAHGYHAYMYAPKSDRKLRTQWAQRYDVEELKSLKQISQQTRDHGLRFGVGLSPINLYQNLSQDQLDLLRYKVDQILSIGVDILAICFDDMKADVSGLADLQVGLTHKIQEWCTHQELILCPSYYSFDPILEQVFGERPLDYWQTIHRKLNPAIGVFWTGPQVCSSSYSDSHLDEVKSILGNRIHIWDNYPVNDGRKLVDYLHFRDPAGRVALQTHVHAQWINPMVQPYLSRFALKSMSEGENISRSKLELSTVTSILSWEISQGDVYDLDIMNLSTASQITVVNYWSRWLIEHLDDFQDRGLGKIPIAVKIGIIAELSHCPFYFGVELKDWLNGIYAFDPACLT